MRGSSSFGPPARSPRTSYMPILAIPNILWPDSRAAALIWVTAARRSDEIRRLNVGCVRREWAPEMRDEHGVPIEPAEELCYLRIPTNKMRVMRDIRSIPLRLQRAT